MTSMLLKPGQINAMSKNERVQFGRYASLEHFLTTAVFRLMFQAIDMCGSQSKYNRQVAQLYSIRLFNWFAGASGV
jgi:hypothetical protein